MSLLMKALANAEKEKKEKLQLQQEVETLRPIELSLTPLEKTNASSENFQTPIQYAEISRKEPANKESPFLLAPQKNHTSSRTSENNSNQLAAANIFTAAQLPKSYFNHVLVALGLVAIGLIVWLGSTLFSYQQASQPALIKEDIVTKLDHQPITNITMIEQEASLAEKTKEPIETTDSINEKKVIEPNKNNVLASAGNNLDHLSNLQKNNDETKASEALLSEKNQPSPKLASQPAAPHALNLISQKQSPSVDPTLLSAYQALNQGQLTQAQQQYRQVLQKDVRNIDALLGMAAIAEKQGRMADAAGWYQKVLEIEPNHTFATTAMLNMQTQTDTTSQISRLKNLIAQQPDNASLHSTLGNIYAQQNDWLSAQAAYFEATRFAPNHADYAFNVAVSLEHLGKPALALLQYQRALTLAQQSGNSSPDQTILKSRIEALQQ